MRLIFDLMWAIIGLLLFAISKFMPMLQIIFLDWIGVIFIFISVAMVVYHMYDEKALPLYEKVPKQKALMPFIRRDGIILPAYGTRIYSGESFMDVPGLGLVEDLGKDCVLSWGHKKIRFVLENTSFTPDPNYMNLAYELYDIGFNNSDEVWAAFNGTDLELMAKVYLKMENGKKRGADKLVEVLTDTKPKELVEFKPLKSQSAMYDMLDKIKGK